MLTERLPVKFIVGGMAIAGNLFMPKDVKYPLPGVILYHGRGGNQQKQIPRAEFLCARGIVCLTFDNRGRGESDGDFQTLTLADGLKDSLTAYDLLVSRKEVDVKRVGILGESFGGYLAAIVSSQRDVKSIVLSVPAVYRNEWMKESYAYIENNRGEVTKFRESGHISETYSLQAISRFTGSLLIISAENDVIVPNNVPEMYYNQAKSSREKKTAIILGADHKLSKSEWKEEFNRLAAEWFAITL
jgi:esterase/lipase